jgi:hypothetical protein
MLPGVLLAFARFGSWLILASDQLEHCLAFKNLSDNR